MSHACAQIQWGFINTTSKSHMTTTTSTTAKSNDASVDIEMG